MGFSIRSGYFRSLQRILLALVLSSAAHSDIFLSVDNVDDALKNFMFLSPKFIGLRIARHNYLRYLRWVRKQRYYYDGAAFWQYLELAPHAC